MSWKFMKHIYILDHMFSGTHIVRFNFKRNNIWWVTNNCPTRRPTWHGLKTHVNCLVKNLDEMMQLSESPRRFTFNFQVFLVCHGCRVWLKGEAVSTLGHAAVRWQVGWRCRFLSRRWRARPSLWRLVAACGSPGRNSKCLVKVLLEMFAQQSSSAGFVVRHVQLLSERRSRHRSGLFGP